MRFINWRPTREIRGKRTSSARNGGESDEDKHSLQGSIPIRVYQRSYHCRSDGQVFNNTDHMLYGTQ
jgi:hypothetical protein